MKSPVVLAFFAISIGLVCAAAALYILKPQDAPITMPGMEHDMGMMDHSGMDMGAPGKPVAPPLVLKLGNQNAVRVIHVVIDGVNPANKSAYMVAREMQQANPDMALNIVPALDDTNPARTGFAWALAASGTPDAQGAFVDSLMGSSGDITPQVLTLLAQNNGLDADKLGQQAQSPEVSQSLSQANNVLPPALPAIYAGHEWLTGENIQTAALSSILGQSNSDAGESRVVVSDAYAYATAPSAKTAAIFLTARNLGAGDAEIVGVSTSVAGKAEIHNMTHENGVMQMRAAPSVIIKTGETKIFDPMGLHIMLLDLPAPLAVGQKFPLTLTLQGGSEISTFVTVTAPGQALTNTPE